MTADPRAFGPADESRGSTTSQGMGAGPANGESPGGEPTAGQPAVGEPSTDGDSSAQGGEEKEESRELDISSPAKVMRIGTMVKQLLEEVRNTDLDEKGRERLAQIHRRSIDELEDGLSKELVDELERLDLPFDSTDGPPTTSELRVAQAQLVGWLEGLFHGIQTAIMAQQAMARQTMAQLPPGAVPPGARPQSDRDERGPGNYL